MASRRGNGAGEERIQFVVDLSDGRSASFEDLDQARAMIRFATGRGLGCRLLVVGDGDGPQARIVLSNHLPVGRRSVEPSTPNPSA